MKTNATPALKRPLEIKRGNVTVKIYAGKNRVNGTVYPQFTLTYYDGAKRGKNDSRTWPKQNAKPSSPQQSWPAEKMKRSG